MIVVSDASPLHYLVLIGHESILPSLFEVLYVPPAVVGELKHNSAPAAVRQWIGAQPVWVRVQSPRHVDPAPGLGPGEQEAIALALELRVPLLLIDERRGRAVASACGLEVVGVLGILVRAAQKGLVDLHGALAALAGTNFRIDNALIAAALLEAGRDAAERPGGEP